MTSGLDIRVSVEQLELESPFRIARHVWTHADNVFVRVTDGDLGGLGEASPDEHWGETPESVVAQLESVDTSALAGPLDLEGIGGMLEPGSARAALDIAMHDLGAKRAGLPLATFLGLEGRPLPDTSVTLPIDDVDRMVRRAENLADHPILKMKVGFDDDVEAVAAIRKVFKGLLRIDANEGWSRDEAIERLRAMEPYGIELCEQPIARDRYKDLAAVTGSTSIPVFADEDASTATDVAALAGVVDGVNLKLRKCGGIRATIQAIAVARAVGLRVMLGCDLHSGVATSAGAHLGSLVDHLDMDGALLLARDPYPGVVYDKGRIVLPERPGLGVNED